MNKIVLQKFIEEKSNRQVVLKERMQLLIKLENQIASSKIGKWIGNTFLSFKRFSTLVVGIILVIGSILFFLFPETLFRTDNINSAIIQNYKTNFIQKSGASLEVKIQEVSYNYSNSKVINLVENLDNSITSSIEAGSNNKLQFIAILVLIIGLILLYIASLIAKIKLKNTNASYAESLTKKIINDYNTTLKEEEKELIILKEFLNKISD